MYCVDVTKLRKLVVLLFVSALLGGCVKNPSVEGQSLIPATPATLSEAIENLSSVSAYERIYAAGAIRNFGEEARSALPYLIQNLSYSNSDVRESAAEALRWLGPEAQDAVQDLIFVAQNDVAINARIAAARALGEIGANEAVPILAELLDEENNKLAIFSAVSISNITGEEFPDSNTKGGYSLNEEGRPLIVIAAQEWWEEEGKFDDWTN